MVVVRALTDQAAVTCLLACSRPHRSSPSPVAACLHLAVVAPVLVTAVAASPSLTLPDGTISKMMDSSRNLGAPLLVMAAAASPRLTGPADLASFNRATA